MSVRIHHPVRPLLLAPLLVALCALPLVTRWIDEPFYLVLASRVLLFALAATSLNLLVGFGGMVSFGHAAFFGAGAYVVAIAAMEGVTSAWVAWPLAMGVSALAAAVIGAISLRTRGVYFIMITLAFAQMMFYVFVSLKAYGGEDGLSLPRRSVVGIGLDLKSDTTFYYVVLAVCTVVIALLWRLVNSRFGRVLQGIRENETRMEAVGFPVYRHKLVAFVIAGAVAGLAGALAANQNDMASPSMLHWNQSGMLLVMVILGGTGTFLGPALGATVMLLLEETLAEYTLHWQFVMGGILLAVVLLLPGGLATLLHRKRADG